VEAPKAQGMNARSLKYRWAVGQTIASLYRYVKNKDLFSNVTAEDLDDWFREELNFVRNGIREHEEEEEDRK